MAQPRRPEFQLAHALYVHNNLVVKDTAGDARTNATRQTNARTTTR